MSGPGEPEVGSGEPSIGSAAAAVKLPTIRIGSPGRLCSRYDFVLHKTPAAMTDFFISYTHADRDWAVWTAWVLEAAGFTTKVQAWDFGAGSNFIAINPRAAAVDVSGRRQKLL